jgi:hypothetical protein
MGWLKVIVIGLKTLTPEAPLVGVEFVNAIGVDILVLFFFCDK